MERYAQAKKVIAALAQRIRERYNPEKIILYGSFAYGRPHKDSDVDLLVIKDTQERPIDRRVFVRRMVSDIRHGYPFSSIVVTPLELKKRLEIGDQFFQEVVLRGKALYEK